MRMRGWRWGGPHLTSPIAMGEGQYAPPTAVGDEQIGAHGRQGDNHED
jgi:hypothetical protein